MNEQTKILAARELAKNGRCAEAIKVASDIVRFEHASHVGLCIAAEVLHQCGVSVTDCVGIFKRSLELKPDYEPASIALVECFLSNENYRDAIAEIDRFTQLSPSTCYEQVAIEIVTQLNLPNDEDAGLSIGLDSRESRKLLPRFNRFRNPLDQLNGIERKQTQLRKQGSGESIRSTGKSQQDLNNELNRIRSSSDAQESPVTFSRDGVE